MTEAGIVTKAEFAALTGVSRGRVSQWISAKAKALSAEADALPELIEDNGDEPIDTGEAR
jgi:DNA-binding transcriptional regulator YiaG